MKKKISDFLKNKYKSLGLGNAIFDSTAAQLEATITDEANIETGIPAWVEPMLKAAQSQSDSLRNENRTLKEKVTQLETGDSDPADPANDPPPEKKPKAGSPKPDDTPAWAKGLSEKLDSALTKIATLEAEKTQVTQAQRLAAILKEKKVDPANKQVAFALKQRTTFKDDAEIESFADEIVQTFGETTTTPPADPFAVGLPLTGIPKGGDQTKPSPLMKTYLDQKAAAKAPPAPAK